MKTNQNDTLVTSSGVIKNRSVARVGVIGVNSELLDCDAINDLTDINNSIDINFEEYILELEESGKTSEEIEELTDFYECDESTWLIGDWTKIDGKYQPDKSGACGFSGTLCGGIICIEWSRYTRECCNTSPCYVMRDGSGPCGDLSASGDHVLAYDLSPEYYFKN